MAIPVSHRSRLTLTPRAARPGTAARTLPSLTPHSLPVTGPDGVQATENGTDTPQRRPREDALFYRPAPRVSAPTPAPMPSFPQPPVDTAAPALQPAAEDTPEVSSPRGETKQGAQASASAREALQRYAQTRNTHPAGARVKRTA